MLIVIDCRFWGPKHTGLGVYTQQLVENLAKLDRQNKYILLVRKENVDEIKLPNNFSLKVVGIDAYSLKGQLALPFILYSLKPDLVHFPSINVPVLYLMKYVVTVHDLIKHEFTGTETTTRSPIVYWLKQLGYLVTFFLITKLSKAIIVPSKIVKQELERRCPVVIDKTYITYEAPTLEKFQISNLRPELRSRDFKFQISLPKSFSIYTGNAYPHKNLPRLIESWKEVYEKTKCKLVLVCGRSVFAKRIEKLVEEKNAGSYVSFLGYLSDVELANVYEKAQAFVFPTLAEGFGLPGLDAMSLGLSVVCSDIPVLHEIYGEAAIYFDPKNDKDIAEKIVELLKDEELREKLVKNGETQVKKYSWEKTGRETLKIYSLI